MDSVSAQTDVIYNDMLSLLWRYNAAVLFQYCKFALTVLRSDVW